MVKVPRAFRPIWSRWPEIALPQRRGDLGDLSSPPGNRLEALAGDRKGQHSIRINDQFRVCFVWTAEGPAEVEIVDYH